MEITIQNGNIETAVQIMSALPEFSSPYNFGEINNRLKNVPHLNLVAYMADKPIGRKPNLRQQKKLILV